MMLREKKTDKRQFKSNKEVFSEKTDTVQIKTAIVSY